jgi:hypothetical protein
MQEQDYRIEVTWEYSRSQRLCIARAFAPSGDLVCSFPATVSDHGLDLAEYQRLMGHLPDADVEDYVRSELVRKLAEEPNS